MPGKARTAPANMALFFGAGAEVEYGMPSGGEFALELFRRKFDSASEEFSRQCKSIPLDSIYAKTWLPHDFQQKNVYTFGKPEKRKVFQDTLESRRKIISSMLFDFDAHAASVVRILGLDGSAVAKHYRTLTKEQFGKSTYKDDVELDARLEDATKLFSAQYFSAAVRLSSEPLRDGPVWKLTRATIELLIGALGQDLASQLNDALFRKKPKGTTVFDDIGGLFSLDSGKAGQDAFDAVLDDRPTWSVDEGPAALFRAIVLGVLEFIIASSLDYQSLIDTFYPYLFQPNDWAKFSKISVFLHAVRHYVLERESAALAKFSSAHGYYHDLRDALATGKAHISAIATSNYTRLCSEALRGVQHAEVIHLNGNVYEFLDPYKNTIVDVEDVENTTRFAVPLLFTQSGVKPMTSVDMSMRYVDYYRDLRKANLVVVAGYGFNGDDGHINGLLRKAVDEDQRRLLVFAYAPEGVSTFATEDQHEALMARLRADRADLVTVLPVDRDRKTVGGQLWISAAQKLAAS